jgi:hypothetical protein
MIAPGGYRKQFFFLYKRLALFLLLLLILYIHTFFNGQFYFQCRNLVNTIAPGEREYLVSGGWTQFVLSSFSESEARLTRWGIRENPPIDAKHYRWSVENGTLHLGRALDESYYYFELFYPRFNSSQYCLVEEAWDWSNERARTPTEWACLILALIIFFATSCCFVYCAVYICFGCTLLCCTKYE